VTEAGWKGFADNLERARELLTRAWEERPDCPEAPTAMIRVTMGGHGGPGETPRIWFDRAVAAEMDYAPAYDRLLWAMRPRWGGSHEAMHGFGVECLETKRFDTVVPLYFFLSVAAIADDRGGDHTVWETASTRRRLRSMFEGYEEGAGEEYRARCGSIRAALAWRLGGWKEARRLVDGLGDDLDPRPFTKHFGTDFASAWAQIRAFTGEHGEKLLRAESLAREGKLDEALALYEEALGAPEPDPPAEPFIRRRAAVLGVEHEFSKGDWVPLRPEASFAGWAPESGEWVVEPGGALRGSRRQRSLWIRCDADLGDRLELRGEMEFIEAPGPTADACIALRCPPYPQRDDVILVINRNQARLALTHTFTDGETVSRRAQIGDANTFHIYVWDDEVTVLFNDEVAFDAEHVDQLIGHGKHQIGFGTSYKSTDVVLRFRNLEARRLAERPQVPRQPPPAV
jgi:hypothetical protein